MTALLRSSTWRRVLLALGLSLSMATLAAPPAAGKPVSGETIYRQGLLASGQSIEGRREAGAPLRGADAACVNCHRRSGLGAKQGRISVPPIAGRYLFHPRKPGGEEVDRPFVEGLRADRDPYTDATLARAIREGIDSQGRPLGYLMPRFALPDADLAALIAYLKKIDVRRARGASETEIHFATIVTPDADPDKRSGMLSVLEHFFTDKNAVQRAPAPRLQSSDKTVYSKMMLKIRPRWQLHVWQLEGPADTWAAQLDQRLAEQPVFAVISGLAGANWAPVHRFCERAALPCLFPNVEAPPADADRDFYSLYFSKGVRLEADLIAAAIAPAVAAADPPPTRVRQVYRSGDVGQDAAQALSTALAARGIAVSDLQVTEPGAAGLGAAVAGLQAQDTAVLWLRAADLAALPGQAPAAAYASAIMGGFERSPVPANWRETLRIAFPVDLPDKQRVRVDYAMGWFKLRHIPVVSTQVMADTYLACGLLAETLSHMVDTWVRDYLVERIEDMLEHRILTGQYPRLSLGQGQRFASKGGYIVRFTGKEGSRVVVDQDWHVPP